MDVPKPFKNPPNYPSGGTFAELLKWHLEDWGTVPFCSVTDRSPSWILMDFARVVHKHQGLKDGGKKNIFNWKEGRETPTAKDQDRVARMVVALFGNDPNLQKWKKDLEDALERARRDAENARRERRALSRASTPAAPIASEVPGTCPDAPYYPCDGTYADLICWHMDYWGTRPTGSCAASGARWEKDEFKLLIWGKGWDAPDAEVALNNWRGEGSGPSGAYGAAISQVLFGKNPVFEDWSRDLENARRRCQNRQCNEQTATIPKRATEPPIVSPVPLPTAHFIGHDYRLGFIPEFLASDELAAILVQGPPGVGKTEVTKAVAHHPDVLARFGGRCHFVPLEAAVSADAMKKTIVSAIGYNSEHCFEVVLSALRDKPSLLILDNLDSPWTASRERRAIETCLADLAQVAAILVSCRGQNTIRSVRWTDERTVHRLTADDSTELLAAIAGEWIRDDPKLPLLIGAMGGLPLAIDLIASRANQQEGLTPLWDEWQKIGADSAVKHGSDIGRLTSLSASIEISIKALKRYKSAYALFCLLGCMKNGLPSEAVRAVFKTKAPAAERNLLRSGLASRSFFDDRICLRAPFQDYAARYHSVMALEYINLALGLLEFSRNGEGLPNSFRYEVFSNFLENTYQMEAQTNGTFIRR